MKSLSLLFILAFAFVAPVIAQDEPPPPQGPGHGPRGGRGEKIEALYVAFITHELNFSEEDAQKFWPVHAQYDEEMKGLKMDMPELDRQQAVLNIKKKYQDKFIKVLGRERTDEFYRKDAEFRKRLVERLQEMKDRKESDRPPGMKMRKRPA